MRLHSNLVIVWRSMGYLGKDKIQCPGPQDGVADDEHRNCLS
jgi:hypothetical protein